MSLFIVPTVEHRQTRPSVPRLQGHGCGIASAYTPFSVTTFDGDHLLHGNRDPRLSSFYDEDDYALYEARLRQQQELEEQRVRQRYAALRRQAELERERERRRIQQQEQRRRQAALAAAAAASAWHAEQQRQRAAAAAALEHRRREAIERQAYLQALEARRKQEEQQRLAAQQQWQHFAAHGLGSVFQIAEQLFAMNKDDEHDGEDEDMQIDQPTKPVSSEQQQQPAEAQPQEEQEQTISDSNAPQTRSIPIETDVQQGEQRQESQPAQLELVTEETHQYEAESAAKSSTPQQQLVFTHPLPSNAAERVAIKADNIQVSFDEPSRTIQIRGLWTNESVDHSDNTTVTSDDESERGRKRSRSPKRSRVSDVDESTGEEIVTPDANSNDDDGFVKVANGKQPEGSVRIPVPEGANVAGLRAELTDDGFQLWL